MVVIAGDKKIVIQVVKRKIQICW